VVVVVVEEEDAAWRLCLGRCQALEAVSNERGRATAEQTWEKKLTLMQQTWVRNHLRIYILY